MTDRPVNARACGLGWRLLAIAYDAVLVLGLMFLAAALALPWQSSGQQALRDPAYTLYLAAVWCAYVSWCWRAAGMTLGMRAWRIRLVTGDGRPLAWHKCILRYLVSLVSAGALGAGFLWSLGERRRRTWHDLATGTRLVRSGPASD